MRTPRELSELINLAYQKKRDLLTQVHLTYLEIKELEEELGGPLDLEYRKEHPELYYDNF